MKWVRERFGMTIREELELREEKMLSKYASLSINSRGK